MADAEVYYITPTQYKTIETFINEEDNIDGDKINSRKAVARKLGLSARTIDSHMHNLKFTLNTNNDFRIAKLFLEGRLIPIDKMKEKDRWQNLQIQHQDLYGKAAFWATQFP